MLWIEGFKETAAELVRLFSFFWACAGCSDQGASKERGRRTDHLVPSALMGKVGSAPGRFALPSLYSAC